VRTEYDSSILLFFHIYRLGLRSLDKMYRPASCSGNRAKLKPFAR
jgi:hypothetical protein